MADRLMHRLARSRRQGGFTLIEVLVALTLLAIFSIGLFPLFITGVRASVAAKYNTQAKNLANERIEQMRNLTFHVAPSEGQFVDLLDIYFTDATNAHYDATHCTSGSYAASTYTCQVKLDQLAGSVTFSQTVKSQFLDDRGAVVTPSAGYDSQNAAADSPPSLTLGVTVTTTWAAFGKSKSFAVYTRISSPQAVVPTITSQARAAALRVSSSVTDPSGIALPLEFEAGVVDSDGTQTTASNAALTAYGAYAVLGEGTTATGANLTLRAPPNPPAGAVGTVPAKVLGGGSCNIANYVCFGPTALSGSQSTQVNQGLPLVANPSGTGSGPIVASLQGAMVGNTFGFQFANTGNDLGLELQAGAPMVYGNAGNVGGTDLATASGYLAATAGPTHNVSVGVSASTQVIDVLPTTFTKSSSGLHGGIVEVVLDSASLTCQTTGAVPTYGASAFSARVRYWDQTAAGGNGNYSGWFNVTPGGSGLPDPATITVGINPTTLAVRHLSDYLTWQALTSLTQSGNASDHAAAASLNGVVTITTAPTRTADPTSVINLSLGNLTCNAVDNR